MWPHTLLVWGKIIAWEIYSVPGWGKLYDMVSLLCILGHSTRLGQALWHGVLVIYLGSFHQVGASFVTWNPCYVSWVIPSGWGKLCDMVSLLCILGHSIRLGASFVTWYPCYVSWVIPSGWGKLCDMVSLLRILSHSIRLGQALWHGILVMYLGSFHQVGASFVTWCPC